MGDELKLLSRFVIVDDGVLCVVKNYEQCNAGSARFLCSSAQAIAGVAVKLLPATSTVPIGVDSKDSEFPDASMLDPDAQHQLLQSLERAGTSWLVLIC